MNTLSLNNVMGTFANLFFPKNLSSFLKEVSVCLSRFRLPHIKKIIKEPTFCHIRVLVKPANEETINFLGLLKFQDYR